MGIKSSPEVVRDMKKTLQTTVKSIQGIQQNVKGAMRSSANWNDAQGQQYQALMKQIAQLTICATSFRAFAVQNCYQHQPFEPF